MITIENSVFDAQGTGIKDEVFGVTLSGSEDVTIKNCTFSNMGYSAILNNSTGNVQIENCTFNCATMYNPIEGSQTVENGNVVVKDCTFNEHGGNNYINFYKVKPNSAHIIKNCTFNPGLGTNTIRLSNRNNAISTFTVENCSYVVDEGTPTDYTSFILCQDYTNKSGIKQDFSKYSVTLDNVSCNGEKITSSTQAAKGTVYYVYEDGQGIITGTNDPVIVIK